jgi:hypothetical protein
LKTTNSVVRDVLDSFRRLRQRGHFLAAWDGDKVFTKDRYTSSVSNGLGLNNHFQGVARLGRYVVISGGDQHRPAGELYVVRMDSRKVTQPFRSNLWKSTLPPEEDVAVLRVHLDSALWHAGGIDALGDVVVVPLEGGKANARVDFYDFTDPEQPSLIKKATIERTVNKASAATLAQLDDGRFVLAVWWYPKARNFDFYVTTDLEAGWAGPVTVTLPKPKYDFVAYQCISFVKQADGALFLLAFENTSEQAPTNPGVDLAHLWRVAVPPGAPQGGAWPGLAMEQVDFRRFNCKDRQANMDAGSSAWVDPSGELHAYSCYHWRQDNRILFSEFRAQPAADADPITEPARAWIDLFEDRGFGGHCLSLSGRADTDFRRYEHVHVEGNHFNDKVSSVRFQIPAGMAYTLFKDADYGGAQRRLVGTGGVVEIPDLSAPGGEGVTGDQVSSSKWV